MMEILGNVGIAIRTAYMVLWIISFCIGFLLIATNWDTRVNNVTFSLRPVHQQRTREYRVKSGWAFVFGPIPALIWIYYTNEA